MALVVLLRGVNVGGHRTFRPKDLVQQLAHLKAVNIGAAGTFVIGKSISRTQLRQEIAGRLPFDAEIMICEGREMLELASRDFFSDHELRPDMVRFVTVLPRVPREAPELPLCFPPTGEWLLQVVAREKQFVVGVYRRQMKAISYLSKLDQVFGLPGTTRNWNTLASIVKVLERQQG